MSLGVEAIVRLMVAMRENDMGYLEAEGLKLSRMVRSRDGSVAQLPGAAPPAPPADRPAPPLTVEGAFAATAAARQAAKDLVPPSLRKAKPAPGRRPSRPIRKPSIGGIDTGLERSLDDFDRAVGRNPVPKKKHANPNSTKPRTASGGSDEGETINGA